MTIDSYSVDAQVNGLFATVRTLIVFGNPNDRVLEGELAFSLPDGASVCGYALDVGGHMRDGVVVRKDEARIAFEAEVKAGVDPGIAEHVKGNVWNTRIYPIPAHGARTIRVEYVTPLVFDSNGEAALRLSMPQERLGERSVSIAVPIRDNLPPPRLGGLGDRRFAAAQAVWRATSIDRDVTPAADIVVAMPVLPTTFAAVETHRGETWFAASVTAPPPKTEEPITSAPAFRILWDASGSRRPADIERSIKAVELLPRNTYYSLVVFRDTPEEERYFSSRAELIGALTNICYDGGTDLAALAATNTMLTTAADVQTILFTDGMDTLSPDAKDISFKALALVSGSDRDMEGLRLACGGRVLDLETATPEAIAHEILHPARFLAGIQGEGVDLVQGIGQPALGRIVVLGRLTRDETEICFDFGEGTLSNPIRLAKSDAREGNTLAQARAAKRIAQLSPRADDNADELLALGREYGLASPKTSLIVLDTLEQYIKHDIEPPESAKELHARWIKTRPDATKTKERETKAAENWHRALKHDWDERVAWHKSPAPRKNAPKSGLFTDGSTMDGEVQARAAASPERERRLLQSPRRASRTSNFLARNAATDASEDEVACMESAMPMAMAAKTATSPKAGKAPADTPVAAQVKLSAWDPKTPYLRSLKDCAAAHGATNAPSDMLYRRYMELRASNATSPAFFLDCAGFFFSKGEKVLAVRILSNLAEMKLENSSLLRTFAWRLREAGEYARAIVVLRKVARLRPEEPHSFRDLALLLGERARDEDNAADAEEAMSLLKKTAFTPWKRQNARAVAVFAVEELNALAAWCEKHDWSNGKQPVVPEWDAEFKHLLDVDLRIILSWDADNTDIDIHVLEPNGEEAYYQNRRTASGGFVSQDITTGYGPEEYLQLKGQKGIYKVLTHYYGSSQQKLTGPATATATVYTDWGRATEKRQILSLRLDKPKEKVTVGEITFAK